MKKLMIAAAAAAMVGGAYAGACEPECPIIKEVARVYQVQFNIYTTKGVMQTMSGVGGTSCVPGTDSCLVMRGKDKTVFRGYVYVCENLCELESYASAFADVRRYVLLDSEFAWKFCNVIGKNSTDAECAWDFTATAEYDETRVQEYALTGAGYGKFVHSTEGFFDNLGGYFAGTATASYDLKSKVFIVEDEACNCKPSQVLKCDTVIGLGFEDSDTVAFGAWKMKFNANVTAEYMKKGEVIFPSLLKKMFK